MTELVVPGTSPAYAAQGRWVARCAGYPFFCSSAADVCPDVTAGFLCADCGRATEVIWPAASMVEGVERLLMMRPNPNNRNWEPGETLHDLAFENALHGIFDGLPSLSPGVTPFAVTDTEIRTDDLPGPRPELQGRR
jgi:hypothetical protein